MYKGLIIKESLSDESILDYVHILNVEIWKTENKPRYWTAITFESDDDMFPEKLSKAMKENKEMPWYVDLSKNGIKYIILKNNVLKYTIGNAAEKAAVICRCRELGVDEKQLDWSE
ncbi:MAG: hypothetical protein Q4D54_08675 [Eubacteriales bacterium]|nr:hypothetical protein [Lachnospiraceae bacterium]MDO5127806.1 hypothetical protein [Eubacteriales bacterium]